MVLWRIVKSKHAASAFDGEGSRRFGGRWNSPGTAMVYGSAALSLAALEILVHMEARDFGRSRVAIWVEIPADIPLPRLDPGRLPPGWREIPARQELATLGDDWIRRGEGVLLAVPSAIVPQEDNLLLNPRHRDVSRLIFHPAEPFVLDPRLLKEIRQT